MEVARKSQRPMAKAKRRYSLKPKTETSIQEGIKNGNGNLEPEIGSRKWEGKYGQEGLRS